MRNHAVCTSLPGNDRIDVGDQSRQIPLAVRFAATDASDTTDKLEDGRRERGLLASVIRDFVRKILAMKALASAATICAAMLGFSSAVTAQVNQRSSPPIGSSRSVHPPRQWSPLDEAPLRQNLPIGGHSLLDPVALRSEAANGDAKSSNENGSESESDFAERLRKLEEEWADYQKELAKETKDAESKPTVDLGGRIQLDYWTFPGASEGIGYFEHPNPAAPNFGVDPEDGFLFRRIRVEAEGDALETMFWRMQVDFAHPESPAIKDVYIGFRGLPWNQELTIGNQKRPIGLDALESSRFTIFLERPFVIDLFDEDYRRLGILAQGATRDESFLWQYGVFELENIQSTGQYRGDAYQLSGNLRLAGSPWYDKSCGGRNYFHWGVAGMLANPDGDADAADSHLNESRFRARPEARSVNRWLDTGPIAGADWYEVLGLESILNLGPLQIVGEYQHNWIQREVIAPLQQDLQFNGYYVYANYMLTGEHIPYDRTSGVISRLVPRRNFGPIDRCCGGTGGGWGAWGLGVRYSVADLSDGDVLGGEGEAWTVTLNWYWTPYARLEMNVITGEINNHAPVGGYTRGQYTIIGTRALIDF